MFKCPFHMNNNLGGVPSLIHSGSSSASSNPSYFSDSFSTTPPVVIRSNDRSKRQRPPKNNVLSFCTLNILGFIALVCSNSFRNVASVNMSCFLRFTTMPGVSCISQRSEPLPNRTFKGNIVVPGKEETVAVLFNKMSDVLTIPGFFKLLNNVLLPTLVTPTM